eukprot:763360-Hanusia_phi.AAC.3
MKCPGSTVKKSSTSAFSSCVSVKGLASKAQNERKAGHEKSSGQVGGRGGMELQSRKEEQENFQQQKENKSPSDQASRAWRTA